MTVTECENLRRELTDEKLRREQLEVQLAGCLTAAEGVADATALKGDYGWSPAYQAVLDLRRNWDALKREAEKLRAQVKAAEQVFDVQVTVLPRKPVQPLAPAVSKAVEDFYRRCTPEELASLNQGQCPDCHSARFRTGPEAGECTNIMCGYANCGSRFNVNLPHFAQRISRPRPNLGL